MLFRSGYNRTGGTGGGGGEIYAGGSGYWRISGSGGGGAPSGNSYPPATNLTSGDGGQGNVRCYYDTGSTSGAAGGVATMAYVTGSTGTNTGSPKMIITNNATGRSKTYNVNNGGTTSFSLADIMNY